jgi:uncharacterized BrkB/YihY/UPF0761 family membrane protein
MRRSKSPKRNNLKVIGLYITVILLAVIVIMIPVSIISMSIFIWNNSTCISLNAALCGLMFWSVQGVIWVFIYILFVDMFVYDLKDTIRELKYYRGLK